jgi:hypothetical protein
MSDRKKYQLAWLAGVLISLVLAPTIALAVLLPNSSGVLARLQQNLYPAVAAVAEGLDFNLVAIAGGPSASVQTQITSTPSKLTGGGGTPSAPSVFGFNATLNPKGDGTYGQWNSQGPRCNGPVTQIWPQPDSHNGFNFTVSCRDGSTYNVRANDNGEGRAAENDQLDFGDPLLEPMQYISNGNIQAHP